MVTSDFGKFGYREIEMVTDLLTEYKKRNYTRLANDYFDWSTMKPAFNMNSGYVFLTDDDYNVVMLNDDGKLDLFISTPYNGVEGFYDEIIEQYEDLHPEDKEYIDSLQGMHKGFKRKNKTLTKNKIMNGNCSMDGFSRVVVPSELNGFTRVNMILPENMNGYELNNYTLNELDEMDGYTLNGRTARRVARWYKKNAPYSYIGTALAGLILADVITKGAVRKKLGLKK